MESKSIGKIQIYVIIGIFFVIAILIIRKVGFYSVPPIGILPEGITLIVWRINNEPFFNSPDALCLQKAGQVSSLGRIIAFNQAPMDRIILRLPYWDFAYLKSTKGYRFYSPENKEE